MNHIAELLRQHGKCAESEAMDRQTLQLETVLGKEQPDMIVSMMGLAESLRQQGRYAEGRDHISTDGCKVREYLNRIVQSVPCGLQSQHSPEHRLTATYVGYTQTNS